MVLKKKAKTVILADNQVTAVILPLVNSKLVLYASKFCKKGSFYSLALNKSTPIVISMIFAVITASLDLLTIHVDLHQQSVILQKSVLELQAIALSINSRMI
jgi:hypothetical protein